jgi:hypothetical protein
MDVNLILKNFESDILKNLDKKANIADLTNLNLFTIKGDLQQIQINLQNKSSIKDLENLRFAFEDLTKDLYNKIDIDKLDNFMQDIRIEINDINKELIIKANIKEMLSLLKNKPDLIDINTSITKITEELDTKLTINKVINLFFIIIK